MKWGRGIFRIKKVINDNILCAVDEKGGEMIVTGRGIGFKRKTGERLDPALIEKTYRMEGKAEQRKLRELCEQIPLEHLRLTQDLIESIKSRLNTRLNESLLITLADHISSASLSSASRRAWSSRTLCRARLCAIIPPNTL